MLTEFHGLLVSACFALAENNEEPRAFGIFPRTIIQPYKLNTSSLIQSNALILGTFTILLGYLQGLGMCMHIILNYIMYILYILFLPVVDIYQLVPLQKIQEQTWHIMPPSAMPQVTKRATFAAGHSLHIETTRPRPGPR